MVGDDHLETAGLRLGDLLHSGDPTVDGEHEPAALACQPFECRAIDAVALVEAARQVPVDLGAVLSAILWNFFFLPPRFTFIITKLEDILMFFLYFVTAAGALIGCMLSVRA